METRPDSAVTTRDRIVGEDRVWATVWWLSWPTMITMFLMTMNGMLDGIFVGQLGPAALSGVGLASQVNMVLMALVTAVGVGTTALVARFIGAGEPEEAEESVRQSILLGVIASIVSGLLLVGIGRPLLRFMGAEGDALRLGLSYLYILMLSVTPYYLLLILTGVFRGMGDMWTPLIVMAVVTSVSVGGDYLLIFGIGPLPRLEVAGAAIANGISRLMGALMLSVYLARSPLRGSLMRGWSPDWGWFRRILSIGLPAAVQGVLRTGASMTYYSILGLTSQGYLAIAALTAGIRTEALAFMLGFAFSTAATSMVGQNLGADQPKRATASAWAAAWQGIWVMSIAGVIFFVLAAPIAGLFTNDAVVRSLIVSYLRINAISEPFLALSMILTGAMQGAGATRVPAIATIATLWFARLPLTYYLAITLQMGANGAWIAMSATAILSGLVMLAVFRCSRWQETAV
ncbi:MAG: MATE family efflux transporter [Armatimonadetes bacterium]|nr:MATE family efflux transporter [Armatimonadota bacterium]